MLYACLQSTRACCHLYDKILTGQRKGRSSFMCFQRKQRKPIVTGLLMCEAGFETAPSCASGGSARHPSTATGSYPCDETALRRIYRGWAAWGRGLRAEGFGGARLPVSSTCCSIRCQRALRDTHRVSVRVQSNLCNCIQPWHWETMGGSLVVIILKHFTTDDCKIKAFRSCNK